MSGDLFLLDTDIVSFIGCQRPPPGLREWLNALGSGRLAISFPTITELRRGAHLLKETNPVKSAAISEWVDAVLKTDFQLLPMTPDVAAVYARMTSTPSLRSMWTVQRNEKHNRLGHDLMVASIAISHGVPIMTGNTPDYLRVNELFPLPGVFHPLRQQWFVRPSHVVALPPWECGPVLPGVALPKIEHAGREASAGGCVKIPERACSRSLADGPDSATMLGAVG